jgi:N-glycosylase/DNA lyase
LNLRNTLCSAQTFRWDVVEPRLASTTDEKIGDTETETETPEHERDLVVGVIGGRCVGLKTGAEEIFWTNFYPPDAADDQVLSCLRDYFRLEYDLEDLVSQWERHPGPFTGLFERLRTVHARYPGIRLLRQEPEQTVFAFICSQNNNAKRIKQLVDTLAQKFGQYLCTVAGHDFFEFPTRAALARLTEAELRELGFGYRAKYIPAAAAHIASRSSAPIWDDMLHWHRDSWLHSLREQSTTAVRAELLQLPGVGPKVSDCISLFSLDQLNVVPLDVHMYRLAQQFCDVGKGPASLTPRRYLQVSEALSQSFPVMAGWAQNVLFAGEFHGDEDPPGSPVRRGEPTLKPGGSPAKKARRK